MIITAFPLSTVLIFNTKNSMRPRHGQRYRGGSVLYSFGVTPLTSSNIRVFGDILHTRKYLGQKVKQNYVQILVKLHSVVTVSVFDISALKFHQQP